MKSEYVGKTGITRAQQRVLLEWAAAVLPAFLPVFAADRPDDRRLEKALETAKRWLADETPYETVGLNDIRAAALAAHAAARDASDGPPRFVARAVGQAVSIAHVPTHAAGVWYYLAKAADNDPAVLEYLRSALPPELWGIAFPQ